MSEFLRENDEIAFINANMELVAEPNIALFLFPPVSPVVRCHRQRKETPPAEHENVVSV